MLEFAPGPIRIPNVIKKSLSEDAPYFASKKFTKLFQRVQLKLQRVFDTKNFVLVGNGSGSLGMEVAVMSFFDREDKVAVITSGKYGDNWCDMCNNHKLNVYRFDASYLPNYYPLDKFEKFCFCYAKYIKGVFVTHFETTSGILNPIDEYLRIYRKYGGTGLFIVDDISSLLTEPLCSDDYDVVIGASQKALSLPPGLFFMSLSDKAWDFADTKDEEGSFYYFDLVKEYEYQKNGKSVFTTSSHLIKALNVALNEVLRKGVSFTIHQCIENSNFVEKELSSHFCQFPKDRGNAVSVFEYGRSPELVDYCYKEGLVIGSGIRDLYENTFRIRTFGWELKSSDLIKVCDIIKSEYYRLESCSKGN